MLVTDGIYFNRSLYGNDLGSLVNRFRRQHLASIAPLNQFYVLRSYALRPRIPPTASKPCSTPHPTTPRAGLCLIHPEEGPRIELALQYRRLVPEEFGRLLTRVVSIGSLSQLLDCQHAASAAAPIRESLSSHAPRSFPSDCATVGGMTAMVYGARQRPAYRFFRRRKPASQSILRR